MKVTGTINELIATLTGSDAKAITEIDIIWDNTSEHRPKLYGLIAYVFNLKKMTINTELNPIIDIQSDPGQYLSNFLHNLFRDITTRPLAELDLSKVPPEIVKNNLPELQAKLTPHTNLKVLHLPPALIASDEIKNYPSVFKLIQTAETPVLPTELKASHTPPESGTPAPTATIVSAPTLTVFSPTAADRAEQMRNEEQSSSGSLPAQLDVVEEECDSNDKKLTVGVEEHVDQLPQPNFVNGTFGELINFNPSDKDKSQLILLNIKLDLSDSINSTKITDEHIAAFFKQFSQCPITTISFSQEDIVKLFDLENQQLIYIKSILANIHLFKNLTVLDFSRVNPNIIFPLLKTISDELGINESGIKLCLPPELLTAKNLSPYPRLCRLVGVEIPGLPLAPIRPAPSKFKGTVIEVIEALQSDKDNKITELEIEINLKEKTFGVASITNKLIKQRGITKIAIIDNNSDQDHFMANCGHVHQFFINLLDYPNLVELDLSKANFDILKRIFRILQFQDQRESLRETTSKFTVIVPKILIDENSLSLLPKVRALVDIERSRGIVPPLAPDSDEDSSDDSELTTTANNARNPAQTHPSTFLQHEQDSSAPASVSGTTGSQPVKQETKVLFWHQGNRYRPDPWEQPTADGDGNAEATEQLKGCEEFTRVSDEDGKQLSASSSSSEIEPSPPPAPHEFSLREKIETGLHVIDAYKRAFGRIHETSLKFYYDQVFNSFGTMLADAAIEYNANCHDHEKLKVLNTHLYTHLNHMDKFEKLLKQFFKIEEDDYVGNISFTNIRLIPAADVDSKRVAKQANALINDVEVKGFHGLAVSIANFITKTLLAIGIPVAATGVGAYVGGVIGGVLGLSTVTFTGPAGLIVGASLGAWIGGAAGCTTGTAGGIYASSKVTFFSPVQTSLSAFAKQAVDYANEVDSVARLKAAAPAA